MARLMALALANNEIAAQLAITKRTVESLVEHIRISWASTAAARSRLG